ncbi:MAG: HEAT repeat domain-containing protein [Candidatus Freyarchaeota archaeon]|nr:HEAT repeat domain-containing protein [Candidatus Jordarchaeia archaeon]
MTGDGLQKQLKSHDEEKQETAAWKLGETANPQAIKILEEALREKPSTLVKVAIWKSLVQLGQIERINDLKKLLQEGGEPRALIKAFKAFRELKNREVLPILINILSHPSKKCTIAAHICQEAIRTLKELGDTSHLPLLEKAKNFCKDSQIKKLLEETIKNYTPTSHTQEATVAVMLTNKGIVTTITIRSEAVAYALKDALSNTTEIPLNKCQVVISGKTLKDTEPIKVKTGDRIYVT